MAQDKAYQKAEKKIEEALGTGATRLDLSSMKLTELPKSLGQLTQLQELDINDNRLTALPESLGRLIKLQELSVYGNQLTGTPESLENLLKLRELWLGLTPSGNPLNQLPAVKEYLRRRPKHRLSSTRPN